MTHCCWLFKFVEKFKKLPPHKNICIFVHRKLYYLLITEAIFYYDFLKFVGSKLPEAITLVVTTH